MNILLSVVTQVLHAALALLAAPLLSGLVGALSHWLAGRDGPPVAQAWHDLVRLFRKQIVRPESASAVARLAPLLSVVVAALCVILIPSFTLGMALSPLADLVSIATLLILGRVILVLAALDSGTGDAGVAAADTSRLAMVTELTLLLAVFVLAMLAADTNLDQILTVRIEGLSLPGPAGALAIAALALLGWADAVRPPLDSTFSAGDLALIRIAYQLRLLAWCDLIGALALPFGMAAAGAGPLAWGAGLLAWVVRLAFAALVLAGARVSAPSLRVSTVVLLALVLCGVAAMLGSVAGGPV